VLVYVHRDQRHFYNAAIAAMRRSNRLWRADVSLHHCSADDESTGYLQGIYVLLKSSGTVVWPIPIRLRTSCKVDITYFPFDDQVCTLLFGSSVYSHSRVAFNVSLMCGLDDYSLIWRAARSEHRLDEHAKFTGCCVWFLSKAGPTTKELLKSVLVFYSLRNSNTVVNKMRY
jgi:Neurotransmitter-gated ion-channel ligand binding domain